MYLPSRGGIRTRLGDPPSNINVILQEIPFEKVFLFQLAFFRFFFFAFPLNPLLALHELKKVVEINFREI